MSEEIISQKKEYWIDAHRFLYVSVLLMIIFFTTITFLWVKADAISKDPCRICSERLGKQVSCYAGGFGAEPISLYFYPNGSVGGTG